MACHSQVRWRTHLQVGYNPFTNHHHHHHHHYIVGGWTNPFQRYARQNGDLPQGSGWKFQKSLSCHLANWIRGHDLITNTWMFPRIVGFPPKSSLFNRVFHYSIIFTIHFGVPLFLETPTWEWRSPSILSRWSFRDLTLPETDIFAENRCSQIVHLIWPNHSWNQGSSHPYHGTGIFTYMNGWFLWVSCR